MSTTSTRVGVLADLALAARLVEQIGEHRVSSIGLYGHVGIHLAEPAEAPQIADELGLSTSREQSSGTWVYSGLIDAREVLVYGNPPASFVVVDSDTGEHLTGRLTRSVADAVVAAEFSRRVRVEQVTR